jgi:hypothetical protein
MHSMPATPWIAFFKFSGASVVLATPFSAQTAHTDWFAHIEAEQATGTFRILPAAWRGGVFLFR